MVEKSGVIFPFIVFLLFRRSKPHSGTMQSGVCLWSVRMHDLEAYIYTLNNSLLVSQKPANQVSVLTFAITAA